MATQIQIAQHLDLSDRKVRDLIAQGVLPNNGDLDACRVAYIRSLREKAAGRMGESQNDEALAAEKLRLTTAQADKTEHEATEAGLKVEVLRGNLIPAERVERVVVDMIAAARAKLLSIPPKAASLALAADGRIEAEDAIKGLIYEALEELREWGPETYGATTLEENLPSVEPPSPPDDQPVEQPRVKAKRGGQRRARKV